MRVLLDGGNITTSGSTVQLTLRGRSSGTYTVQGLSIVQREGATVNGVDSTWRAVTFGGQSSVTVPANGSVTSDSIPFDLVSGQDVFVTFWVPADQDPVYRPGGSQPMVWVLSGTDESGTVDWENLSPRSASWFNRNLYVVEQLAVFPGGGGSTANLLILPTSPLKPMVTQGNRLGTDPDSQNVTEGVAMVQETKSLRSNKESGKPTMNKHSGKTWPANGNFSNEVKKKIGSDSSSVTLLANAVPAFTNEVVADGGGATIGKNFRPFPNRAYKSTRAPMPHTLSTTFVGARNLIKRDQGIAPTSPVPGVQEEAYPDQHSRDYLHLAAFRQQGSTLTNAIDQVSRDESLKQGELEEVLVRTQSNPQQETVTEFVYDGDGGRVLKTVTHPTLPPVVTVYIGQHYVCQGTDLENLSCAKMIFANGQRIAMVQVDNPTKVTYFHPDHLGSTSIVTNENTVVEQEYTYYPFGATNTRSGAAEDDVHYKYTGQELDGSTDLYFYHARYYDSHLGRFISADRRVPDPANPQDFNRYSYVRNNPLLYVDPTGEAAVFALYRFLYGGFVGGTSATIASQLRMRVS